MSHKSVDYKLATIKDYLKYKNYSETSRRFNCPLTSLMHWVKKYNNTKSISRKNGIVIYHFNKTVSLNSNYGFTTLKKI